MWVEYVEFDHYSFVQAMTRWSEVQKRAQQKIDSVLGEDRSAVCGCYCERINALEASGSFSVSICFG
jgi:hypothetical protein